MVRRAARSGDWSLATTWQRRVLALDPADWRSALIFCRRLRSMGECAPARGLLTELQQLQPHQPDILVELGHLQGWMGQPEAACESYAEAQRLSPTSQLIGDHVRAARDRLAERSGSPLADWVVQLADAMAQVAAGDGAQLGRAAELAVRLGDYALGEQLLRRYQDWARDAGPDACHLAARQCADFYWLTGRWSDALAYYLEAESHLPKRPTLGRPRDSSRRLDRCMALVYPSIRQSALR